MHTLLDTHAFLWWMFTDNRLTASAKSTISDDRNTIFISAASAWEIATKVRIGKLPGAVYLVENFSECLREQGFQELPVTVSDGLRAGNLPGDHRDPFDRMLMAQALALDIPLISNEEIFDAFSVRRIW